MSDPTYRIDVEHHPGKEAPIRWAASVIRISDEKFLTSFHRFTEGEAVTGAVEWIMAENTKQPGYSLFVDDDGQRVEAHSVKA